MHLRCQNDLALPSPFAIEFGAQQGVMQRFLIKGTDLFREIAFDSPAHFSQWFYDLVSPWLHSRIDFDQTACRQLIAEGCKPADDQQHVDIGIAAVLKGKQRTRHLRFAIEREAEFPEAFRIQFNSTAAPFLSPDRSGCSRTGSSQKM